MLPYKYVLLERSPKSVFICWGEFLAPPTSPYHLSRLCGMFPRQWHYLYILKVHGDSWSGINWLYISNERSKGWECCCTFPWLELPVTSSLELKSSLRRKCMMLSCKWRRTIRPWAIWISGRVLSEVLGYFKGRFYGTSLQISKRWTSLMSSKIWDYHSPS